MKWGDFIEKRAQAPGFIPTPLYYSSMMPQAMRERTRAEWGLDGAANAALNQAVIRTMVKAPLKSARDLVPNVIEDTAYVVGGGAARDFAQRHAGDPLRRLAMAHGGNRVRGAVEDMEAPYARRAESGMNAEQIQDYRNSLGMLEGASGTAWDLAMLWKPSMKGLNLVNKGGSAMGRAAERVLGRAPKLSKIVSRLPHMYLGWNLFGGPEIVEGAEDLYGAWQHYNQAKDRQSQSILDYTRDEAEYSRDVGQQFADRIASEPGNWGLYAQ